MAERKHTHGLSIEFEGSTAVLRFGRKQIWDGADLSLLRDTLARVHRIDGCRSIAIDLATVQFLPSGFFGQLMDWSDRGVVLQILNPHERIRNMRWFQEYFAQDSGEVFTVVGDPSVEIRRAGDHGFEPTLTVSFAENKAIV
jgi:hypothetical protein